jgi:hypothetical protein
MKKIVSAYERFMAFAKSYLFRAGGAYSIGICRIALFGYLYIHVFGDAANIIGDGASYISRSNVSAYYPKSVVWALFPYAPPSAAVIDRVLLIAMVSTAAAAVGAFTRPAMILSTLSNLFLASLIFSWEPLWSHPYNSGLLAGLAFMFGRAGDRLSIDSLVARYLLRRPISIDRDVYWWPVILGQFAVATVYFGGFYAKWSTPDFTYNLAWVFSDNLRNSVALPWLIRGQELPWNVSLLVNTPWLWKLSAFGHLATQALPILAIASLNRPWIRLGEGMVFVAGVVLLRVIMGMWNPSWIILAAFFVDWEYFLRKAGVNVTAVGSGVSQRNTRRLPVVVYSTIFATLNLAVILTRFDDTGKNRYYPLSSMGFYSNVAALKPYNKHKHYPFTYGELIFHYPSAQDRKWNCYTPISSSYLMTYASAEDPAERVRQQVGSLNAAIATAKRFGTDTINDCVGTVDVATFESADLFSSILNIPPYPELARFDVSHRALVARFEKTPGRTIAASGQVLSAGNTAQFKVASAGLHVDRYEILLANDPWRNREIGSLIPVTGAWDGALFTVDKNFYSELKSGAYPYVVRVTETSGRSYDFFGGVIYR